MLDEASDMTPDMRIAWL
jgi:hypothetical protein